LFAPPFLGNKNLAAPRLGTTELENQFCKKLKKIEEEFDSKYRPLCRMGYFEIA